MPHLIPKRLASILAGASGSNSLACYRMGEGPFVAGPLAAGLELALKAGSTVAGNVVPDQPATLEQFQADLAATRKSWDIDEA